MFDKFKSRIGIRDEPTDPSENAAAQSVPLLGGAYRRHRYEDVEQFTNLGREAFPDFAHRISCFGADWLGRQFAADSARIVSGRPQVLMLEPGTGEALEIPADVDAFHSDVLVNEPQAAVASEFYADWISSGGKVPEYNQCVGYDVPLFLGGADDTTNLSISDFDVYWTICAQLLSKVRSLPPGTKIRDVSISD